MLQGTWSNKKKQDWRSGESGSVKLQFLDWQKMPKNELSEKCPISYGHPKLAIMVQIRPYLKQYPN